MILLKTQQNKADGSWCLCCIYDWLLLNMIADDIVLILDSAQHRVPFSENERVIVTRGHIQLSTQSSVS